MEKLSKMALLNFKIPCPLNPQINLSSYFSHMSHLSLTLTSSLPRLKGRIAESLDNRDSITLKKELQQKAYKEVRLEIPWWYCAV